MLSGLDRLELIPLGLGHITLVLVARLMSELEIFDVVSTALRARNPVIERDVTLALERLGANGANGAVALH